MENSIRKQLTLFVDKNDADIIEEVRQKFNPRQRELINCHVTLCREDELKDIEQVLNNLTLLEQKSITIKFGQVTRFDNGKGVLIPATTDNQEFQELRQKILFGIIDNPRQQEPHITLMHPRNSNCTEHIFEEIKNVNLPAQLTFRAITLIKQINGGQWTSLKTFNLME